MTRHRHAWREIDPCCLWCPICDAEKYHEEIIRPVSKSAYAVHIGQVSK